MTDLDHFSEITEETMDGEAPAGEEQERAEDGEEKSDMEELTALCERLLIRTMAMQNSLVDLHAEIKENRLEYNRDRKNMWLVLTDLDEARQEFLDEKKKRKEAGGLRREKAGKFPQNQMTVSEQCGKIAVKIRQQILRGGLQL